MAALYDRFVSGLAGLAGLMLLLIVFGVVYDVVLRAIGLQPPAWTGGLSEYSLLFITMLAAPWLVRTNGHVAVDSLVLALPAAVRRVLEPAVYVLCVALCLTLAYFAAGMGLTAWERGDIDIRSIDMPRWLMFAALAVGFALTAVEFARALVGGRSLYAERRGLPKESL